MDSKVNYIAVGLFVLALGTAFIAGILRISTGGIGEEYDLYVVYMTESVSGLSKDGPVKYRGVDVGKVAELALDPKNPERVRVLLKIERGTPIKEDTVATLETQGLTGIANISLVGGHRTSPPLRVRKGETYPVIESKPSRLAELGKTLSELLTALTGTANRLNALLNGTNQEAIAKTLAHLETVAGALAGQSQNLSTAAGDFSATMHNVRQASSHLPTLVVRLEQSAVAMERMANDIAAAGANLNQAIAVNGQRIDRFTSETLPEAGILVSDLHEAAENLRHLSQQLESDPSVLFYGLPQPPPGPGE